MQHTQILTNPVNFKTEISNVKNLELPNQKTAPNPKMNGMQVKCKSTTPNETIAMDCCLSLLGGLSMSDKIFRSDNGNVHRAAAKTIVSKSRAARGSVCNVLLSDHHGVCHPSQQMPPKNQSQPVIKAIMTDLVIGTSEGKDAIAHSGVSQQK